MSEYADRDPMALDKAGNYYLRHVSAMTREGLHAKSDIAAELGWRDVEIDRLRARVAALEPSAQEPAPSVAGTASALRRYQELEVAAEVTDPVERLRAFCSFAMNGQDWLDVEQFFDEVKGRPQEPEASRPLAEPVAWLWTGPGHVQAFTSKPPPSMLADPKCQPLYIAAPESTQAPALSESHFEQWWEKHGQFCRAGGGDYEKTFAFRAWEFALATPEARTLPEPQAPDPLRAALLLVLNDREWMSLQEDKAQLRERILDIITTTATLGQAEARTQAASSATEAARLALEEIIRHCQDAQYGDPTGNYAKGIVAIARKYLARPPAPPEAARVEPLPDDITPYENMEAVIACLGDDAATLRHDDIYPEMADNMDEAAMLLSAKLGSLRARPPAAHEAVRLTDAQINSVIRSQPVWRSVSGETGWTLNPLLHDFARAILAAAEQTDTARPQAPSQTLGDDKP